MDVVNECGAKVFNWNRVIPHISEDFLHFQLCAWGRAGYGSITLQVRSPGIRMITGCSLQATRHLNLNSGLFYLQSNTRTIGLMNRIAARLSKEKAWDQSVFNEEIFFLSHDDYLSPNISVRVMNIFKFMNSKVRPAHNESSACFYYFMSYRTFYTHASVSVHVYLRIHVFAF